MNYKKYINKWKKKLSTKEKQEYNKERKKEFHKQNISRLKKEKEKIKIEIMNEHKPSLDVVNMCVFPFVYRRYPYAFCRTEPFYSEKKPNFDILLKHRIDNKAILIECKSNLATHISPKLQNFKDNIEKFEKNIIKEDKAGHRNHVKDFVASYGKNKIIKGSGNNWYFEYVLASNLCAKEDIQKIAFEKNMSFCLWRTQEFPSKKCINIKYSKIEGKNPTYIGHKDKKMCSILAKLWKSGCECYHKLIDFTLATNINFTIHNVLLAFHSKNIFEFNYDMFCDIFRDSLLNYYEEEKKFIFKNIISKCLSCGLLIEEKSDSSDIYKKTYHLKTLYKADRKRYVDEIYEKLASLKVKKLTRKEKEEISYHILKRIIKDRGGKDLTDYT